MGIIAERKTEWEEKLLATLREEKTIRTAEVSDLLHISESTARRFVSELENKNVIARSFGKVHLIKSGTNGYLFGDQQMHKQKEKEAIGRCAADYVENGDCIFVGNGTTVQCFAMALAERLVGGTLENIQVFTNSFVIISLLDSCCDVSLIGGLYRSNRQDFSGYLAEMILKTLSFNKCFMGTDGIAIDDGSVTAGDMSTARIDEILLKGTEATYLLTDASKLNRRSLVQFGVVSDMHMIITDNSAGSQQLHAVRSNGGKILIAGK